MHTMRETAAFKSLSQQEQFVVQEQRTSERDILDRLITKCREPVHEGERG